MSNDDDSTIFTLRTNNPTLKLDTADDLAPFIAPLTSSSASSLKEIHLNGNSLGEPACKHLASIFPKLTSLTHANLADIFTARLLTEIPPSLDALLQALLELPSLRTINLSDNAFGLNTAQPLVKYLERATSLRHLILNNNGLGPHAGILVADALTQLAEAKSKASDEEHKAPLETIVCGRNRLENGSMAAWAKAMQAHSDGLKEVRMVQNGIRSEGSQMLLREGLGKCKKLVRLDLQDNTFTKSGAKALADVLDGWVEMQELGVSDCLISARGAVWVGEALQKGKNERLEVLKCAFGEIDAKGVAAIVRACESGSLLALRRVELNGNVFAEEEPEIERLRDLLLERRRKAGKEDDEEEDEMWGLDELDELEEPDDEEEEDESEAEQDQEDREAREKGERQLKQTDEAENENVAQKKDAEVDDLADQLGKTL